MMAAALTDAAAAQSELLSSQQRHQLQQLGRTAGARVGSGFISHFTGDH